MQWRRRVLVSMTDRKATRSVTGSAHPLAVSIEVDTRNMWKICNRTSFGRSVKPNVFCGRCIGMCRRGLGRGRAFVAVFVAVEVELE